MIKRPDLFILRHGETTWNRKGRFQGQKDSPLTAKGRKQAKTQKIILSKLKCIPNNVYVSPLGRALETARLAVGPHNNFLVDDRLKEINFGAWEGLTREQIMERVDAPFSDDLWQFRSPQGETFAMISYRVAEFLDDLTEPSIIITHGITSIVLRGLCIGLDEINILKLPKDQGCVYHLANGKEEVLR